MKKLFSFLICLISICAVYVFTTRTFADTIVYPTSSQNTNGNELQLKTFKILPEYIKCPDTNTIAIYEFIHPPGAHSIGDVTNLLSLQANLLDFTHALSPQNLLAFGTLGTVTKLIVPLTSYGTVSQEVDTTLAQLSPERYAYEVDAFRFLNTSVFKNAIVSYPQAKQYLLYISDTIPEVTHCDRYQQQATNCSTQQDASSFPDLQKLKDLGVTIYTVAFVNDFDEIFNGKVGDHMRQIASDPARFYRVKNDDDLRSGLVAINKDICKP